MKSDLREGDLWIVPQTPFEKQWLYDFSCGGVEGKATMLGEYPVQNLVLIIRKKKNKNITITTQNI